jgi:hypothetical protein
LVSPAAIFENICSSVPRDAALAWVSLLLAAEFTDLAGLGLVLDDDELFARQGRALQAQHFHRHRRAGAVDILAAVIDQGAHAAPFRAGDEDISDTHGAALDQDGGDGAAAALQPRLDHRAAARAIRIGFQLQDFRLQHDAFGQLVEIQPLLG